MRNPTNSLFVTALKPEVAYTKVCSLERSFLRLFARGRYPSMMSSWWGAVWMNLRPLIGSSDLSILDLSIACASRINAPK